MSASENAGVERRGKLSDDEMHDRGRPESEPDNPLSEILAVCESALMPTFEAADRAAVVAQDRARKLTAFASWFGFAALAFLIVRQAILPLGIPRNASWGLLVAELLSAVASCVFMLVGLAGASRRAWLVARHRAERCRLSKFRFLLDPMIWSRREGDAAERRRAFETEAVSFSGLSAADMVSWLCRDTVPSAPAIPVGSGIPQHTIHSLMDYYEARRLRPQLDYFARRTERAGNGPKIRPPWGPILFFVAVAVVLVHAVLEIGQLEKEIRPVWAVAIAVAAVILAAGLPALSSAVRAWRLAHEFGRGGTRYEAKSYALNQLAERMSKAAGAEAIFRELNFCEDVLESDHRDWLRLMADPDR